MPNLNINRNKWQLSAVLIAVFVFAGVNSAAALEKINQNFFGVAIKGYDTVAYHTEGKAVKGSKKFSHEWNDARWYFSSEENRDMFVAEPERFAPQYGGY